MHKVGIGTVQVAAPVLNRIPAWDFRLAANLHQRRRNQMRNIVRLAATAPLEILTGNLGKRITPSDVCSQ